MLSHQVLFGGYPSRENKRQFHPVTAIRSNAKCNVDAKKIPLMRVLYRELGTCVVNLTSRLPELGSYVREACGLIPVH
jgi:hypothetical protein